MKPSQARCSGAQMKRIRPPAKDYFRFGEEPITFLAGSRTRSTWNQVACTRKRGPGFANFTVIPATGVNQLDRRINCLDLHSIPRADALNTQNADPLHRCISELVTGKRRIIGHPHTIGQARNEPPPLERLSALLRGEFSHNYFNSRAETDGSAGNRGENFSWRLVRGRPLPPHCSAVPVPFAPVTSG